MPDPNAGVTLAAAEQIRRRYTGTGWPGAPVRTYTDAQAAYVAHLAHESGRTSAYLDGLAELHAGWARSRWRRRYAELVADRLAADDAAAAGINARLGRPAGYRYDGGPVDWETGRPLGVSRRTNRRAA